MLEWCEEGDEMGRLDEDAAVVVPEAVITDAARDVPAAGLTMAL